VVLAQLVIHHLLRFVGEVWMRARRRPDQLEPDSLLGHQGAKRAVQLLHHRAQLLPLVAEVAW